MTAPLYQQANHLAGEIVQDIYDDFWAKTSFRYEGTSWELLGSEDSADLLGRGCDDPYFTLLRRESDGQLFEIEIEVTARAVEAAAPVPVPAIPGQQELPGVTP